MIRERVLTLNSAKEEFTLMFEFENVGQNDAPEFKIRFHCREVKGDKETFVNRGVSNGSGPFCKGDKRVFSLEFPRDDVEASYKKHKTLDGLLDFCSVRIFYRDILGNAYFENQSLSITQGGSDHWWDGLNISRIDLREMWRFTEKKFIEMGSIEDIDPIRWSGRIEPYFHALYESSFIQSRKMARLGEEFNRFSRKLPQMPPSS